MYKPFFSGNIFAYIEFIIILGFFIFLMYKNFSQIKIIYINKFTVKIKILILLMTILLNGVIYIILDIYNINWIISIAINAFIVSLIVSLSISAFWGKNK